jgi:hypothetical protein
VQHKAFPYLEQWLGLIQVVALEPKPGVEPTSAHLSTVLAGLQTQPAKMILRAAYNDGRGAEWLSERTKLPIVVLHDRRQRAGQGSLLAFRRHRATAAEGATMNAPVRPLVLIPRQPMRRGAP